MRGIPRALIALAAAAALAVGAGCGGDDDAAEEPAPAPDTATRTAPADTSGATSEAPEGPPEEAGEASVAAGRRFFMRTCQGCHLAGGTTAGVGPVLADSGLTAERIETAIRTGPGPMPEGLAEGEDLDNVVAYVMSLQ